MPDVVSISEAKANLSKLVKRALAGETIFVGAYGQVQAVLGPVPMKRPNPVGIWADRKDPHFDYDAPELIGSDPEIAAALENSVNAGSSRFCFGVDSEPLGAHPQTLLLGNRSKYQISRRQLHVEVHELIALYSAHLIGVASGVERAH